jgi:Trk-type K+ transport system membrane component
MGLRTRLLTQAGTQTGALGDVRRVVQGVVAMSLGIEAVVIVLLTGRFLARGEDTGHALYSGVFHGVSAFFNGGFALYSDSLTRYATDPWVIVPVAVAVTLGSLGFPVLFELRRELRTPRTWSTHTKLTLIGWGALLVVGAIAITASEWTNPRTLGGRSTLESIWLGSFQGLTPRSSGFNTLDYSAMHDETWLMTDALMFVGGGSAGAGGGIKVTTFMVLVLAILAEVRGEADVNAFGRRLPFGAVRQALAVAATGVLIVTGSTIAILAMTNADLDRVLFDVISAATTTGLSTGITPELPPAAQYLLAALMFAGRTGTITFASALALRERRRLYRLPEERPIVG